jgi:hypothetical protein
MISLINNTKSNSKPGYLVSIDPSNKGAFVYTTSNSTKAIGVITESVPYRSVCKIATIGDTARIYVATNLAKGDIIRSAKSGDNISLGACTRVKNTDTAYLRIGEALESGSGLIPVILELSFTGNSLGVGYVPYTGATEDVDLGEHLITSGGSHVTSSDDYTYPDEPAISEWWMDGVGGFLASRDWSTLDYLDTYFEGENLYFGVYSDANSLFYGDAEFHETVKIGSATDHILVDGDGEMTFVGDATVWDDMRIVPSVFDVPGNTDPDVISYQPAGSGATFKVYGFAKGDEGFFTIQFPHTYKVGSTLKAHVHWTPGPRGVAESGNTVQWRLDYSIAPIGSNFPASTTISLADACDGVNHKHQMTAEVDIPGVGVGTNVSAQMWGRIYRWNNASDTWAGIGANLPIFIEFDIHYEIDSVGSKTSSSK